MISATASSPKRKSLSTTGLREIMLASFPLVWDNHIYCDPSPGGTAIDGLLRHQSAGFNVGFLNLGDSNRTLEQVVRMAAFARSWLRLHSDRFVLLRDVRDIERAQRTGRMAVGFNIEGVHAIGDQHEAVRLLRELGVGWMALVYNRRNQAGFGVHDPEDGGLTDLGKSLIDEMDAVGVIKCLSHTGYQTAMDVLSRSSLPCIFSHSNASALQSHARNIPDVLIRACAETGGVIGVNGINIFLGDQHASVETMVRHIDYIAQLVGADHVGLGFDYGYVSNLDIADLLTDANYWPAGNGYDKYIDCVAPERIADVVSGLEQLGYSRPDLSKILGENMLRVARAVWRSPRKTKRTSISADAGPSRAQSSLKHCPPK